MININLLQKKAQSAVNAIRQTELSFLICNKQRTQSRWLNIDTLIDWGQFILDYQKAENFTTISQVYRVDSSTPNTLLKTLPDSIWKLIIHMPAQDYPNKESYSQAVIEKIGEESFSQHQSAILEAASVGKRRFDEKLGWVSESKNEIEIYAQMIDLVKTIEHQLKHDGLNTGSISDFEENIANESLTPRASELKEKIISYINREIEPICDEDFLPSTSDIIESLFGKYKIFLQSSPLNEISKMILMLPLFVTRITGELIKKAMESVRCIDVNKWADDVIGQSSLSKRRLALKPI
jgi:hypothetical protein